MGRLIDVDEVKKRYPIMENDFGMVINDGLHKELDKIPTVEAIPLSVIDNIKAEIEDTGAYEQETMGKTAFLNGINYCLEL